MQLTFKDLDLKRIENEGYDKILITRNGQLFLAGRTSNISVYNDILKDMKIKSQKGNVDIWEVEVE